MVMRKTIKRARAKLRPMAPSSWRKILSEFPEITDGTTFPGTLLTQGQEQPRDVCPNFRKFQVLSGIFDLNSVEWFPL